MRYNSYRHLAISKPGIFVKPYANEPLVPIDVKVFVRSEEASDF